MFRVRSCNGTSRSEVVQTRYKRQFEETQEKIASLQIVQARVPEISESMQIQLVNFVQGIRELDLKKQPAISETIDWAKTLILLNSEELEAKLAEETLNILLKHQQDIEVVKKEIPALISNATETSDGKSIN